MKIKFFEGGNNDFYWTNEPTKDICKGCYGKISGSEYYILGYRIDSTETGESIHIKCLPQAFEYHERNCTTSYMRSKCTLKTIELDSIIQLETLCQKLQEVMKEHPELLLEE